MEISARLRGRFGSEIELVNSGVGAAESEALVGMVGEREVLGLE